jgi:hypothetical protein
MKIARAFQRFIKNSILVSKSPKEFYKAMKIGEFRAGLEHILWLYFVNRFIVFLILVVFPFLGLGGKRIEKNQELLVLIYSLLISIGISILLSFVFTFLIQLLLKIFKTKSSFKTTYQIYAFSQTPASFLEIFPIINILAFAYSFWLTFLGLEISYKLSKGKTIAVLLLPYLVISGLLIAAVNYL